MYKKLILIFGILILIVIAGCEGRFFKKVSGRDSPITDVDIRQGTEGLTMEFTKNAPPKNVFEGGGDDGGSGIFPVAVKLENKGAYDINDTEIKDGVDKVKTIVPTMVFGFEKTFVDFVDFVLLVKLFVVLVEKQQRLA